MVDMRWYANNALTSVAVLFLGGLAFALAVHHLLREQTAVRLRQKPSATVNSRLGCRPGGRG